VAERIESFLRANGYDVWRDEGSLSGNLVEGMAKAVLSCDVIMALLSDGYGRSTNCRLEASYAARVAGRAKQSKKIIPLVAERRFDITTFEWLDFLFGGVLHYDVTENLEATMAAVLSKELQRKSITVPKSTQVVPTPFSSPVYPTSAPNIAARASVSPKDDSQTVVVHVDLRDDASVSTVDVVREVDAWLETHGSSELKRHLAKFGFKTREELIALAAYAPKDGADMLELEPAQRGQFLAFLAALRKLLGTGTG
jgi:hypothetical protein